MKNNTVTLHGRQFQLSAPPLSVTLRLLNILGDVGIHAEERLKGLAGRSLSAAVYAVLAVLNEDEILRLGSALLQFQTEAEGVQWLSEHGVELAPLMDALFINLELSNDLMAALGNFTTRIQEIEWPTLLRIPGGAGPDSSAG
jgi:hypothetical protein